MMQLRGARVSVGWVGCLAVLSSRAEWWQAYRELAGAVNREKLLVLGAWRAGERDSGSEIYA